MRRATPPFSKQVKWRLEVSGVTSAWVREHFGEPQLHEDDPLAVLAPTDYWAVELDSGAIVVLGHMPEHDMMLVESDSTDTQMLVSELGLASLNWAAVKRNFG